MTTCKHSAVHSFQTGNGSLQIERSGETARGQTAIAPVIPRSCSSRRPCREHSPQRISLRPPGTDWGQFHYAAVQDRIVRSPRTCRSEKTCDRSYPRSDELAGLPKLLVMPDRSTSKAGAVSSRLRVSIKSGNLNACNTGWTSTIALILRSLCPASCQFGAHCTPDFRMPCARFSPQRRWNGWAYSILRVSQDENL